MPAIYPNQLSQKLSPLPPLILLWGDDAGALRHTAEICIKATGVDPQDPFAAEKFTLPDLAANSTLLPDSAQTLSFTSPHRLIVIGGISGEERKDELLPLLDAVKTTLALPLQSVTIIITVPKLLEKTSPLVKAVESHSQALSVRFFQDSARDLATFLQTEFKAAAAAIQPEALRLMADSLGADRDIARREVEKLILYAGAETPITEAHVHASLAGAIAADAFRLAEAVGSRNPALTDRLLQHLLQQGEDLNAAFSLTLRHLQALKTAQSLKSQGQPDAEILKATGKFKAPAPVQAEFLRQVSRYPKGRLATLPAYAVETLSHSRSGLLDGQFVLQRALLALSA